MSLLRHHTSPLSAHPLGEGQARSRIKETRETSFNCEMGAMSAGISFLHVVNLSFDTEVNTLWQASFSSIYQELLEEISAL